MHKQNLCCMVLDAIAHYNSITCSHSDLNFFAESLLCLLLYQFQLVGQQSMSDSDVFWKLPSAEDHICIF